MDPSLSQNARCSQRKRLLACVFAVVSATLLTAASAVAARTYYVTIDQMRFNPPTLTVHPGDHVVWVNKDLVAHTASSNTQVFDSRSIAPNASWSYVASRAGSFAYSCTLHPTMHGTLIVQ
jgi:plastocyanin